MILTKSVFMKWLVVQKWKDGLGNMYEWFGCDIEAGKSHDIRNRYGFLKCARLKYLDNWTSEWGTLLLDSWMTIFSLIQKVGKSSSASSPSSFFIAFHNFSSPLTPSHPLSSPLIAPDFQFFSSPPPSLPFPSSPYRKKKKKSNHLRFENPSNEFLKSRLQYSPEKREIQNKIKCRS